MEKVYQCIEVNRFDRHVDTFKVNNGMPLIYSLNSLFTGLAFAVGIHNFSLQQPVANCYELEKQQDTFVTYDVVELNMFCVCCSSENILVSYLVCIRLHPG